MLSIKLWIMPGWYVVCRTLWIKIWIVPGWYVVNQIVDYARMVCCLSHAVDQNLDCARMVCCQSNCGLCQDGMLSVARCGSFESSVRISVLTNAMLASTA